MHDISKGRNSLVVRLIWSMWSDKNLSTLVLHLISSNIVIILSKKRGHETWDGRKKIVYDEIHPGGSQDFFYSNPIFGLLWVNREICQTMLFVCSETKFFSQLFCNSTPKLLIFPFIQTIYFQHYFHRVMN